jgi:hypothetical protein
LLDPLADQQEEMRSKQIALTLVEQAMFNSIMQLPPERQVTALRRFIHRMERRLSEMSVQTVPAAQKATTAALCNVAGACAAVADPPATSPSSTESLDHKRRRLLHRLEDSEHPENVGAALQAHIMDPANSTRQIHPPSEQLDLHEIHSPSEECQTVKGTP